MNREYKYARELAENIWAKLYKEDAPDWEPLPDLLGVLTQIDNMVCDLERPQQSNTAGAKCQCSWDYVTGGSPNYFCGKCGEPMRR